MILRELIRLFLSKCPQNKRGRPMNPDRAQNESKKGVDICEKTTRDGRTVFYRANTGQSKDKVEPKEEPKQAKEEPKQAKEEPKQAKEEPKEESKQKKSKKGWLKRKVRAKIKEKVNAIVDNIMSSKEIKGSDKIEAIKEVLSDSLTNDFVKPDFTKPERSKFDPLDTSDFIKEENELPLKSPYIYKPTEYRKPVYVKPDFTKPERPKFDYLNPSGFTKEEKKEAKSPYDYKPAEYKKPEYVKPDFTKERKTKIDPLDLGGFIKEEKKEKPFDYFDL